MPLKKGSKGRESEGAGRMTKPSDRNAFFKEMDRESSDGRGPKGARDETNNSIHLGLLGLGYGCRILFATSMQLSEHAGGGHLVFVDIPHQAYSSRP